MELKLEVGIVQFSATLFGTPVVVTYDERRLLCEHVSVYAIIVSWCASQLTSSQSLLKRAFKAKALPKEGCQVQDLVKS